MVKKQDWKTLWILFSAFFKAGTFTFAGGLAMLPVIEQSLVEQHKLLERDEFLEYATLSQTLPGIIALNCAAFVGRRAAGLPGMLIAGFGACVSAFVFMIAATVAIQYLPQEGPALGAILGVRAASAAFIFSAAVSLGAHHLKSAFAVAMTVTAFVLVFFLRVSAPMVILFAGIAGYLYRLRPPLQGKEPPQ